MEEKYERLPVLFEDSDMESLDLIMESDDDIVLAYFDESDADRLDFLADLLDAAAAGTLTEQQELALEGLKSWFQKKKEAVKKRLPPGTKMVFGKIVKVGKGAVGAAKAVGRAAVTAKRGVQAHTYGFTKAGKQAKAAAKKVRDTHGRAAGKASYGAAKRTYQAASRAGETRGYAASQASKAQGKTDKKAKAAEYGDNAAPSKKKAPAKKAPAQKAPAQKSPSKKAPAKKPTKKVPVNDKKAPPKKRKRRVESMEDVFRMVEW